MAHSCPICDQYCTCGGDIDDMQLDGTEEQENCSHCDNHDPDNNDYDFDEQEERNDPNDSRNL